MKMKSLNSLRKLFIYIFVFILIILPAFSSAQNTPPASKSLVPCDNISTPCDYNAFLKLVNTIINFILTMSLPICAVMFAYAGFLLITSGGGEGRNDAKKIFTNAAIGLFYVIGAFIIVKTILTILGYEGGWLGF